MDKSNIDIGLMDTEKARFERSDSGFLTLDYNGEIYYRVGLRRVMPQMMPFEYISVVDSDDKEIGIIKNMDGLADEQAELIKAELSVRYYTPRIKSVESVKDNMGFVYIDASLGDRKKSIAVKDISKNIKLINDETLIIFDVDGNRYIIDDISKIDKKSLRLLEPYLF